MRSQAINPLGELRGSNDVASVQLSGSLVAGFVLARPITVELFVENDEYVASVDELNMHAFGDSQEQALRNLRERIVAQHRKLLEQGDRLGPAMKQVADRLSAIVVAEHAELQRPDIGNMFHEETWIASEQGNRRQRIQFLR